MRAGLSFRSHAWRSSPSLHSSRGLMTHSEVEALGERTWAFGPDDKRGWKFKDIVDRDPLFLRWAKKQRTQQVCSESVHHLCEYAAAREAATLRDSLPVPSSALPESMPSHAPARSQGAECPSTTNSMNAQYVGKSHRQGTKLTAGTMSMADIVALSEKVWPFGPADKTGLSYKVIAENHPNFVRWIQQQRTQDLKCSEAVLDMCAYVSGLQSFHARSLQQQTGNEEIGGDSTSLDEPSFVEEPEMRSYWSKVKNSKNVVFVGGLPYQAFSEDLHAAFEELGDVQNAWIVFERRGCHRRSCLYGFVEFKEEQVALDCKEIGVHHVLGKEVEIRTLQNTYQELMRKNDPGMEVDAPTTVFIGRLVPHAQQEDVHAAFSEFGEVAHVRIGKQAPGSADFKYGFVEFSHARGAHACLAATVHAVLGEQVDVRTSYRRMSPPGAMLGESGWVSRSRETVPDKRLSSLPTEEISRDHPFFTDLPEDERADLRLAGAATRDLRTLILRIADIITRARPEAIYFAAAPHLKIGWDQRAGVDIAFLATPDLLLVDRDAAGPGPSWTEWVQKLAETPGRFAVYETDQGHHAFLVSQRLDSRSLEALQMMHSLHCDEWYICFAVAQGFRVRLSPKTSLERVATDFVARPMAIEDLPCGVQGWPEQSASVGTLVVGKGDASIDDGLRAVMRAKQELIPIFSQVYRDLSLDGGLAEISRQMRGNQALKRYISKEVFGVLQGNADLGTVINLFDKKQATAGPDARPLASPFKAALAIDIGPSNRHFVVYHQDGRLIEGGEEDLDELCEALRDVHAVVACNMRGVDLVKRLSKSVDGALAWQLEVHDVGLMKNALDGPVEDSAANGGPCTNVQLRACLQDGHKHWSRLLTCEGAMATYLLNQRAQSAVASMETAGLPFDPDGLAALVAQWQAELIEVEAEAHKISKLEASLQLNLQSSQDVEKLLVQQLPRREIEEWPRTPGGAMRTDASTILRSSLPAAQSVVRSRELHHALSHYTSFGSAAAASGGRLFPVYQLGGAITGRMCCASPNVQAIPRQAAFRELIAAPPEGVLVKGDFSQVELRVLAEISGDDRMREAFATGHDLHRITAAALLGVPEDEVTSEQRQLAKAVNFGLIYGQSASGLSHYARDSYGVELTAAEAETARSQFFTTYPGVAAWQKAQRARVAKGASITTPSGRIAHHLAAERGGTASSAVARRMEREALNFPIQGGAAEIMLASLDLLSPHLSTHTNCRLVCVVHDEFLLECTKKESAESVAVALQSAMLGAWCQIFPDTAPLDVQGASIAVGQNWASLEAWHQEDSYSKSDEKML
ncbi:unnamed protein product [Polarella glacialis]|uniref:DNA-directed DNA polymerase n=1 Tax=Polarella glacialis TaxID=89957 RepID=A0A813K2M6_POLGL|nr:unnamed protein product [Polarella glacialis]